MTGTSRSWFRKFAPAICLLVLGAAGRLLWAQEDCAQCHDQGQKTAKSVHGALTCDSCHEKHEKYPHPANVPKPQCSTCHEQVAAQHASSVHGQELKKGNAAAPACGGCHGDVHETIAAKSVDFRKAVPDTCGMCHDKVAAEFKVSVHGKAALGGVGEAPVCTDCHGEHNIIRHTDERSPVNAAHIRETCASCHGDVRLARRFNLPSDKVISFDQSFHGLAAKSGSQSVANCASCHGIHNILASDDPKSMIHAKNLPATCGKCHPGAGQRFAIGQIHVVEGRSEPIAMTWVRQFYLIAIPLTIGLMILHNGGDWVRKLIRMRARGAALRAEAPVVAHPHVRMLPFERVQHALLVISFSTLVWSGFALKYPDQWWAQPLLFMEGSQSLRGWIHRIAGVVMIVVSFAHVISLMVSPRLRKHWYELFPRVSDAREGWQNLMYNLGLRRQRPARSAHSYIEKAEYWAVVWGTLVMAVTGVMLWATNLMLAYLPKSWLDVATAMHFYEAVLATLAIVVWHLYGVIFDPEVYPLDTAFLTGRSVKDHEIRAEDERAPAGD